MNRATPVQLRRCLEIASMYARAGIRFVPVPVATDAEADEVTNQAIASMDRIEKLARQAETEQ